MARFTSVSKGEMGLGRWFFVRRPRRTTAVVGLDIERRIGVGGAPDRCAQLSGPLGGKAGFFPFETDVKWAN